MMSNAIAIWAEEIAAQLKSRFGRTVYGAAPIDKGWLNVKWRMDTDAGPLFVKYYHPDRYKLNTRPERRSAIERTLQLQQGLSDAGVPCPGVHAYGGMFIQETQSGLLYTVLDWTGGYTAQAGSLSSGQMFELGAAAGKMHRWLQAVPPLDRPAWTPDKDGYMRQWQGNREQAVAAGDEIALDWLERSRRVVEAMDFRLFGGCVPGWLHWDLWVDNILLHERGVSGIVDFDRMTMAYPEIDVARALLSGALQDGVLRRDAARAFMDGYREHAEAPRGLLLRAMAMLYLIESVWWLRTEVRAESELRGLLGRFVEEMHWIEDSWPELPELLGAL